jgi:hypothetical protein
VALLWSGQFPLLHPVTAQALALSIIKRYSLAVWAAVYFVVLLNICGGAAGGFWVASGLWRSHLAASVSHIVCDFAALFGR